jgi:hypothetical protein
MIDSFCPMPAGSMNSPPPLTPPLKGEGNLARGSSPSPLRAGDLFCRARPLVMVLSLDIP